MVVYKTSVVLSSGIALCVYAPLLKAAEVCLDILLV